uniref:DNA mismatch repair protein S5 domain-containing protein n=1 Tax=Psilocybe cubensis TaxID=181762 RepID=A0A8H8CGK4_PSICU
MSEPKPIRRLDENLINKIAAGEIIHRPASALKELVENSLDAGATSIKVTVKDGGMKLLQIQDNGCGIRKSDLPILAERFTTSKLSTFSDLSRIATYGFRGEALASISHVARLSVVTKTKPDSCAWKATYVDGSLVDAKTGEKADPRPCAGNDGTTITIEDLFYNTPTRLSALRSSSEEYARILDVLTKYAIHNPTVSFLCKKAGSPSPDLSTPSRSDTPTAIRLLYGHSIAKELVHHTVSSSIKKKRKGRQTEEDMDVDGEDEEEDQMQAEDTDLQSESESWSAEAYFSNANYQAKKMVFLLFINHRLVESPRMKRALEACYVSVLPKGTAPFVYLSLQIDPRAVDVNVHPTKREVHFLNEEQITERIADAVQMCLAKGNASRRFEYQTTLMGGILGDEDARAPPASVTSSRKRSRKERDQNSSGDEYGEEEVEGNIETSGVSVSTSIRTSVRDRTLDSMFPIAHSQTSQAPPGAVESPLSPGVSNTTMAAEGVTAAASPNTQTNLKSREVKESQCFLTSVKTLRQKLVKGKHPQLTEILEKHIFIGIVDLKRCLSLIQCSTKLYLVNHDALAEELFYQLGLRQFGDMSRIKLDPAPSLHELVQIAVDAEDTIEGTKLTKAEIVQRIVKVLVDRREMLAEYFSLTITEDARVESIPLLLRDYIPNLDNLPSFLMRLGPQVDWSSEMECFETFLRELAYFYVPTPPTPDPDEQESGIVHDASSKDLMNGKNPEAETAGDERDGKDNAKPNEKDLYKSERWQIQHILFPAMRRYLIAPKSLLDRDVVQIANLPDLYKVFERC